MKLGDVIIEWLRKIVGLLRGNDVFNGGFTLGESFVNAFKGKPTDASQSLIDSLGVMPTPGAQITTRIVAALTGKTLPQDSAEAQARFAEVMHDPRKYMLEVAAAIGKDPDFRALQQTLGQILIDLVIVPLETTLDEGMEDPKVFSAQFHGSLGALTITSHIFNLAAQVFSLGQLRAIGDALRDLYFNFGLGFMGWQTISPLLDIGVKESGARFYNRRYRPRRWTVRELMDLFALGKLSRIDLEEELRTQGYRNQDIALSIELAQTRFSVADSLRALDLGLANETTTVARIAERGYRPEDAAFIVELEHESKALDQRESVAAIAKSAFRKGVIDEPRLRAVLTGARYDAERIELEIAIGNLARQEKERDITIGQVESAYKENVLGEPEARHYLELARVDPDAQMILVRTWDAEKTPAPLRINARTVSDAYIGNILPRVDAANKLKEVGWSPADAELILRVAELQLQIEPRVLPVSLVEAAFKEQILTRDQAATRLSDLGFEDADRVTILDTWAKEQGTTPRKPSVGTLTAAFKAAVLTREQTGQRLVEIGLAPADVEIVIATAERDLLAPARKPTEGRVVSAYTNGIVTYDQAVAKLRELNFNEADANFLLRSATIAPKPTVRRLSEGVILDLFLTGNLDRATTTRRLIELGYTPEDAELVIVSKETEVARPLSEAVVVKLFTLGAFGDEETISRLERLGYTREDAILYLASKVSQPTSA